MSQPYTTRELDAKFDDIMSLLVRIEEQTSKTNGRVTALEMLNSKEQGASDVKKYIGIFTASVLLSYLAWIGSQIYDINKTLSMYEVEIQ